MFPLFPFAAGLLAGVAAVRLARSEKAQKRLDKAQERLREATVSSLSSIEQSSARLREKLQSVPAATEAPVAPTATAKPAVKKTTRRKTAAKPKTEAQA